MRAFFCETWRKKLSNETLSPLENQISSVIESHPEYHDILADTELAMGKEYLPENGETNPFLHMSMHLGIHEQIATNRPEGIQQLYLQATQKLGAHEGEHQLMDCLAEALWSAQKYQQAPDDLRYLDCIKEKIKRIK